MNEIQIIHFNDVYNIEGLRNDEPVGGAARFQTILKRHVKNCENSEKICLVLFSGDAFSPSVLSTLLKGAQMPPVLNSFGIDCAMVGNHDLDFSVSRCQELIAQTNFPWLLSNAKMHPDRQMVGERLLVLERKGIRIGIMGLVEYEWLSTLATLNVNDIIYTDFVDAAKELSAELRKPPYNADCVIALTHMRKPNDVRLAQEAGGCLDLVLGGHDHHYEVFTHNDILVCKSGTDFKYATKIDLTFDNDTKSIKVTSHEKITIDSNIHEDADVKRIVDSYMEKLQTSLDEPIGTLSMPLDARFKAIRTSETGAGNLVADVIRCVCGSDIAILNSGTLRADKIFHAGPFTKRDLVTLLPMADELCVIEMSGATLLQALENGVSQWPRLEGRFPQVSGLSFSFDASRDPGNRVVSVHIGNNKLEPATTRTVALKEYLRSGKDGYHMFKNCPLKLDAEHLPVLQASLLHFFEKSNLNGASSTLVPPLQIPKQNGDQQHRRIILLGAKPVPIDDVNSSDD